jgi:PAS domain-containing protein
MLVNARRATPATIVLAGVYVILGVTAVLKLFYLTGAFSELARTVRPELVNMVDVARYVLLGLAAALLLVERLEVQMSANASDAARAIEATERENEERFRLIANAAPVMIWMSDVDKQVTYVNQRWLEFTGWPPAVSPGHRWIQLIHPDDVEQLDGVEATRRLRVDLPDIQILGFSVYPRMEEPHPIERAGAEGFFTKGVDTERLIHHLLAKQASLHPDQAIESAPPTG